MIARAVLGPVVIALGLLAPATAHAQGPGEGGAETASPDTALRPVAPALEVPPFPDTLAVPGRKEEPAGEGAPGVAAYPRPFLVLLRSAAVPGWGQWTNRKRAKALLVLGARAGLTVSAVREDREVARWVRRAATAATPEESARALLEAESHAATRDTRIWTHVAVALYSMADAYVDAHLRGFRERFELALVPAGGGFALSLRHRFS